MNIILGAYVIRDVFSMRNSSSRKNVGKVTKDYV